MLRLGGVVLLFVAVVTVNGQRNLQDYMTLFGLEDQISCSFEKSTTFGGFLEDTCFLEIFNNANRPSNRWSLHKGKTQSTLDAEGDGRSDITGPDGSRTPDGYYLLFDSSQFNDDDGFQPYAGNEFYVDAGRYEAHTDERCMVFWVNSNTNVPIPQPSTLTVSRSTEQGLIEPVVDVLYEKAEVLENWTIKKVILPPSEYKYAVSIYDVPKKKRVDVKVQLRFIGLATDDRDFQDIAIDDLAIFPFTCNQISDTTGTPVGVLSEWSAWTDDCSGWCGMGETHAYRDCVYEPCVDASYIKTRECDNPCRLETCPAETPLHYCNWEDYNDDNVNCFLLIADDEDPKWEIATHSSGDSGPVRDYTFRELLCNGHFIHMVPREMEEGESTYLATGKLELDGSDMMCFQFYLSMRSSIKEEEMGSFRVYIWQDFKKTVVYEQDGVLPTQDSHWHHIQIDVTDDMVPEADEEFMIVLEGTKGTGSNSVIAVDDMRIDLGACVGPVKGYYTQWTEWVYEDPLFTCGDALMFHRRECVNPNPNPDDEEHGCKGPDYETRPTEPCPRQGGWNQWSEWGDCTPTCGEARKYQYRECCDPLPIPADDVEQHCWDSENSTRVTYETRSEECNTTQIDCNTDGRWTEWTLDADGCDAECGGGNGTYFRNCTDPAQSGTGNPCMDLNDMPSDYEEKNQTCNLDPCPVDGNWTTWSTWSTCSQTCGLNDDNEVFKQEKTRTCTNPAPEHGGAECEGEESEYNDCGDEICPRDGGWGQTFETPCDADCGVGNRTTTRRCDNPEPSPGGRDCYGVEVVGDYVMQVETETTECNAPIAVCPVNGNWSPWTQTEANCPFTCGFKRLDAERICNNPIPDGDGEPCDPEDLDVVVDPTSGADVQSKIVDCDDLCNDAYECTFRDEQTCHFEFSHTPSRFEVLSGAPNTVPSLGASGGVVEDVDGGVHFYLNYDPTPENAFRDGNSVDLGPIDQYFYVNILGNHAAMCLYFNIFAANEGNEQGTFDVSICESAGTNCQVLEPESPIVRKAEWQTVYYSINAASGYTLQFRVNNLVNNQDFGFDSFRFLEGVSCGEDAEYLIAQNAGRHPYNA